MRMAYWHAVETIRPNEWVCGYCGNLVGGNTGYYAAQNSIRLNSFNADNDFVYVCPRCENPTVFAHRNGTIEQIPGPMFGNDVDGLPETVEALYREIRECVKPGCYTSAVLSERKLLMHIAVDNGAEAGKSFYDYVGYLSDAGYVPPNGKDWVDEIRKRSNEANHEIVMATQEDACQLLDFIEMLLKFIYEFPSRVRRK